MHISKFRPAYNSKRCSQAVVKIVHLSILLLALHISQASSMVASVPWEIQAEEALKKGQSDLALDLANQEIVRHTGSAQDHASGLTWQLRARALAQMGRMSDAKNALKMAKAYDGAQMANFGAAPASEIRTLITKNPELAQALSGEALLKNPTNQELKDLQAKAQKAARQRSQNAEAAAQESRDRERQLSGKKPVGFVQADLALIIILTAGLRFLPIWRNIRKTAKIR